MTSIIYEIVLCSFLTFVSTDLRTVIYKYTHIGHRNTAGFIRSVLSGLAESSLSYFVGQKYSQLLPFCIHTYRVPDKWFSLRIPACNEAEVLNRSWWVAPSLAFWALTSFQIRYGYRYFTTSDVTFALPKLVLQSAWTNKTEDVLRHIVVYYTIHNFQYTEFYDRSANFSSLCVAFFIFFVLFFTLWYVRDTRTFLSDEAAVKLPNLLKAKGHGMWKAYFFASHRLCLGGRTSQWEIRKQDLWCLGEVKRNEVAAYY